jgi:hypothetical protein
MSGNIPGTQIPDIADDARAWLALRAEGNGLSSDQVRLTGHNTTLYDIPGATAARLKPEVRKSQLRGRVPTGEVTGSAQQALARANGTAAEFTRDQQVVKALQEELARMPGGGWGAKAEKITLTRTKKDFCCFETCQKCAGRGRAPCGNCTATGFVKCTLCGGDGKARDIRDADGLCDRCVGRGRINCDRCSTQRHIPCQECGQRGTWTDVWSVVCVAQLSFGHDPALIPPGAELAINTLGLENLTAGGYATLTPGIPETQGEIIYLPLTAHLAVAEAEFQVGGRQVSAQAAGLRGNIVRIEPLLDPCLKPGINALLRLSKGPLAAQSLMAQACKYKLLRDALANCASKSKKAAYMAILEEYPLIVSDKYARAAAQHAGGALDAVGKRPRIAGLAFGALAAGAVCALYWRAPQLRHMVSKPVAADVAVWLSLWGLCVAGIRALVARGLNKILPQGVRPPVSAGPYAAYAGLLTFTLWAALAFPAQPEWLVDLLHRL